MFNHNEPLWLPRGSVRAIIAIVLTLAFVVKVFTSPIAIDPKDLQSILILAIGFYFIQKAAGGRQENGG